MACAGLLTLGCTAPAPSAPPASPAASLPAASLPAPGSVTTSPGPPPPTGASPTTADTSDGERGRPGTEDFWPTQAAAPGEVSGYVSPPSLPPGGRLQIRVATSAPTVRIAAYRIGAYAGGRGRLVWSTEVAGRRQTAPDVIPATRTVVARWEPVAQADTTGWPPGFYLVTMTAGSGGQWVTPLVVRSPRTAGRVVLTAPLATWQAYNDWGGRSLYHGAGGRVDYAGRSLAVSFDRPYPSPGAGEFLYGVLPFVVVAESAGIPLAYLADTDLHSDPQALDGARGLVSIGHDEYWTRQRRDRVTAARDRGTNLLFTGANAMYWRIRLERGIVTDDPTGLVVGYKDAAADPLARQRPAEATVKWKDEPSPEPTQSLLGTRYECFPVEADWTVTDPAWWGFAGTGVVAGTAFPRLLAVEADRVYPGGAAPSPMEIVAHTRYSCQGRPTSAQAVYYTSPSGAGVINLNSLRWTCALDRGCRDGELDERTTEFTTRVTRTLVTAMAQGPLGRAHPARDTVADFHLPSQRTVYPG